MTTIEQRVTLVLASAGALFGIVALWRMATWPVVDMGGVIARLIFAAVALVQLLPALGFALLAAARRRGPDARGLVGPALALWIAWCAASGVALLVGLLGAVLGSAPS